ncbi:MAG: phosphopantothenoylcysteine decarboxylase [Candidatus Omnitrophica bacterium]|nr:phosphopantothenoylcysteine decarboxylase [Candidatus Omnitrophota bacterium]
MNSRERFLIVSGPTREPIDPVRFLSNYSTGTMGKYLAQAAKRRGYKVTWIQCPKDAPTALLLRKQLRSLLPRHDVLIMAAAVCDVRPVSFSSSKIKKENLLVLRLVKNPDILADLAKRKRKDQIFIGFGLESSRLIEEGRRKLKEKGLELIVLQNVTRRANPFGDKAIRAVLLDRHGVVENFPSISKRSLAGWLIRRAAEWV